MPDKNDGKRSRLLVLKKVIYAIIVKSPAIGPTNAKMNAKAVNAETVETIEENHVHLALVPAHNRTQNPVPAALDPTLRRAARFLAQNHRKKLVAK